MIPTELVVATTNYDRSIEIAFEEMGVALRTGFRPGLSFVPATLDAKDLGEFREGSPSVIYLHGAVGWQINDEGAIASRPASEKFNPTLGRPAVLYPDPTKEVERDETRDLWTEFRSALAAADVVLVLGHSLNDPHLRDALAEQQHRARIGVVRHAANGSAKALGAEKRGEITELLPEATVIAGEFGPEPKLDKKAVRVLFDE